MGYQGNKLGLGPFPLTSFLVECLPSWTSQGFRHSHPEECIAPGNKASWVFHSTDHLWGSAHQQP